MSVNICMNVGIHCGAELLIEIICKSIPYVDLFEVINYLVSCILYLSINLHNHCAYTISVTRRYLDSRWRFVGLDYGFYPANTAVLMIEMVQQKREMEDYTCRNR